MRKDRKRSREDYQWYGVGLRILEVVLVHDDPTLYRPTNVSCERDDGLLPLRRLLGFWNGVTGSPVPCERAKPGKDRCRLFARTRQSTAHSRRSYRTVVECSALRHET